MLSTAIPTMTFELASGGSGRVLAFVVTGDEETGVVGVGSTPFAAIADAIDFAQADAAWRAQHPEPCTCGSIIHGAGECPLEVAA